MKLLFIFKTFKNGGIASVMVERLNYLVNNNFEIHILTEFENDPILEQKLDSKIKIHLLPIKKIVSKKRIPILGYFQVLRKVKRCYEKIISDINPDLITAFDYGYNSILLPKINTTAIKVLELHGSYSSRVLLKRKKDIIDYFNPKLEKRHNAYDLSIMVTEEDLKDRKYLKTKKTYVYNSIQLPINISDFALRENIILAAGTLTHNKNFIDLIEALNLIKDSLINWQIHIYGEGEEKELLHNRISEYQLEEIVFLKGHTNDLSKHYNNAKLLISTSVSEGFGRTLTEALSYKIPVIAYNCKCGPKEIIKNGVNGYLIEFSVEDLAMKILSLISNSEKILTFSQHAWDDIEKFNNKKIMLRWVDIYKNIAYD